MPSSSAITTRPALSTTTPTGFASGRNVIEAPLPVVTPLPLAAPLPVAVPLPVEAPDAVPLPVPLPDAGPPASSTIGTRSSLSSLSVTSSSLPR